MITDKVNTGISSFLEEDFLLENRFAQELYHDYAKLLPIIDYHCHLPPEEIANDKQFENLTQIWLNGDHYKWRAMRANGVAAYFITGEASDWEKFEKWAETVPYTIRNPLFHWTHLELKRYFGVDSILKKDNAKTIFDQCNLLIHSPEYKVKNLLRRMNVEVICTTDDPTNDLCHHQKLKSDQFEITVLPTFRPDKAIFIGQESFSSYINQLGKVANISIENLSNLLEALEHRVNYFHEHGCRLSDHGLEHVYSSDFTEEEVNGILQKKLKGEAIAKTEAITYQSAMLFFLGKMYHAKGWVQQFHLGALRNVNSRFFRQFGPDIGFDSIGDYDQATTLGRFLDRLDKTNQLAKTILYNLNPKDNEVMATMAGNFNDGSVAGKMQFGSGWWFLDQLDGMEKQINTLSNMGLLSHFVGMLTDSRSFLSYPRHEYFRRLLCNIFGKDIAKGHLPNDINWIGKIIQDICYYNAKNYFKF